ncbi:MAG: hypothetical protein NXI31_14225 [bacterium]|nr:hypothetical protein [bacterium]
MIGTTDDSPQRFPGLRGVLAKAAAPMAAALATLCLLLGPGCSGGGGGGAPQSGPVLFAAAYTGSNPSPQSGDTVLLFFSTDVQLAGGAVLSDADFTLSGSDSFGTISSVSNNGSRSIAIVVGSGVSLTPGSTTIALSMDNDVIQDTSGRAAEMSDAVTLGTSDGSNPTLSNITIAEIDGELNGTGAAGGILQVPQNGWSIDLTFSDNGTIAAASTFIAASMPVSTPSGSQGAGTNLTPFLTLGATTATTASFTVPSTVSFPAGDFTLTCIVVDTSGLASSPLTFTARARQFPEGLRPFETNVNASQVWYLDFARDVESFNVVTSPTHEVQVVEGANSVADFVDILRVIGLATASPVAQNSCTGDVNDKTQDRFKTELLAALTVLFPGANVTFTTTQPAGTFTASSVGYSSFPYSQISIAGSATSPGTLGIAIFDPSNTTQDDNTQVDFGGTRLGVFLHTIADAGLQGPGASLFRQTFDDLAPSRGGTPIGADANDCQRIDDALNDGRATTIDNAIADFARFTAIVIAHECGHSMGLVENGAMPIGLYGNDTTNFGGSSDGHIRNTSLFPTGATNVMSPTLTYSATIDPASMFNTLNLAYLREQIFYGN